MLVKAHYQADMVQEALRELGIPSVQHGSSTIFESNEALDLLRILRAANDPSRERLVREALLTGTMGISANQVAEYLAETRRQRLGTVAAALSNDCRRRPGQAASSPWRNNCWENAECGCRPSGRSAENGS